MNVFMLQYQPFLFTIMIIVSVLVGELMSNLLYTWDKKDNRHKARFTWMKKTLNPIIMLMFRTYVTVLLLLIFKANFPQIFDTSACTAQAKEAVQLQY